MTSPVGLVAYCSRSSSSIGRRAEGACERLEETVFLPLGAGTDVGLPGVTREG
jgi:hypothetical protein